MKLEEGMIYMGKIEKNMYVRTDKVTIIKYNPHDILYNEFENNYYYVYDTELEDNVTELVTKASYEIIDLIQVGDYVNYLIVIRICVDEETNKKYLNLHGSISEWENEDIKSVLTKEQFESMVYEVK